MTSMRSRGAGAARALFNGRGRIAGSSRWLLVALVGVLLLGWLDPVVYDMASLGLSWRNALPVVLLAWLVYALFGRVLLSICVTTIVLFLVFYVNAIKERQMNMPLMPGDWVLKDQLLNNFSFFGHYMGHGAGLWVGVIVFLAFMGALWHLERRWARPRWGLRLALGLVSLALLYTVFRGEQPWEHAYSDDNLVGYETWDPLASVNNVGLVAGLVRMTQDARVRIPKAARGEVATFASTHSESLESRVTRKVPSPLPDIVVVQSEAFFEPGILKGIEVGKFAPNFARLAATGISGALVTPAYGGGTIRTEFETLTGYPMSAFPSIIYPYFGLAASWMPSVPRRLQQFGYSTTLFHPFEASFWNRQQVMPELGFEHSYYEPAFDGAARAGAYVSDRALFNFVLARLQHETAAPRYSLVITMENHGPWDNDPVGVEHALDGRSLPSGLSAQGRRQFVYYASHLVNGDAALGDFVQRLMARPRWTVLLFYGDHLPALDAVFTELGFDDGKTYEDEHTHYMLISNRPLASRHLDVNAYELPGLLFDTIGLPMDGYLAFDGAIRQAETQAPASEGPHFGQISINAARMEVRCERKLNRKGKCRKPLL